MITPRIGLVSVARPAFKGNGAGAARRSAEALIELAGQLGFELVAAPRPVEDVAGADAAARAVAGQRLDYLLIQLTTFATGEVVAPLLAAVPRSGLWGLPEREAGRGPGGPLPLNSLCGLSMTLSLLGTPQVGKREPVKWFYGDARDSRFRRRLAATVAALRGLRALQDARVLAIGGTAPGFYGLEETPTLQGATVLRRDLDDLFQAIASVSDRDADARVRAWRAREPADVGAEQLRAGARIDLALERMAREVGASALAVRCWPELPDRCGAMACAAMGNASGRDTPAACEGDVMGALSMLALQGVTGEPAILMDLSDVDESDDSLQAWHCGNAPPTWAAAGPSGGPGSRLTTHFNRDGTGVVRDMRLRPGPVAGFRLLSSGRRAVIVGGTVRGEGKPGFDGVRGWIGDLTWAATPLDVRAFVANLLDRRLPHHLAFGRGELDDALHELAAQLRAEVVPALAPVPYLRP